VQPTQQDAAERTAFRSRQVADAAHRAPPDADVVVQLSDRRRLAIDQLQVAAEREAQLGLAPVSVQAQE